MWTQFHNASRNGNRRRRQVSRNENGGENRRRRRDAPRPEAVGQFLPRRRQPAAQRPLGDAEFLRRVAPADAAQLAQHDRRPKVVRQPVDFLVEDSRGVIGRHGRDAAFGHGGRQGFPLRPSAGHGSRPQRHFHRDRMQPGGQPRADAGGGGFASQHDERGLEGVVGEVGIGHDAAADGQHQRPVPADQLGERPFVAGVGEPPEQVAVGLGGDQGRQSEQPGTHAAVPGGEVSSAMLIPAGGRARREKKVG